MTLTIPTPTKHWVLYPVLVGVAILGFWLWRDTATKDQTFMQQLVKQAQQSQKTIDQQAVDERDQANKVLTSENASLKKQLADAKTVQQQIDLINKLQGTKIEPAPQTTNPLPDAPVPVSPQDISQLATKSEECAEDKNQVAANTITIRTQQDQINARNDTIAQQGAEIKSLKGSHLKRFLTTVKWLGIGVGTGILVEKSIGH